MQILYSLSHWEATNGERYGRKPFCNSDTVCYLLNNLLIKRKKKTEKKAHWRGAEGHLYVLKLMKPNFSIWLLSRQSERGLEKNFQIQSISGSSEFQFSSVQSPSGVLLFTTPCITPCQASLSITNHRSLLKLMPIESVMPSSHLILCRSLLLLPPIPPSIRASQHQVPPSIRSEFTRNKKQR